jgi:PPK2 family polyphosphate:nucleotide phosphotransferase
MDTERFRILQDSAVNLKDHPTDFTGGFDDKKAAEKELEANVERLAELQDVLYAQNVHALLIIIQAMDAAGKDSVIKHVMSGINPQGCQVYSFKQPSAEELDHDFLWRCAIRTPERGRIGIFNRSHYEEVLVVRVHPQILEGQNLPDEVKKDPNIWKNRFRQIRNFEDTLEQNGVHTIKFFLNVSKDVQKKRFLDRIEQPDKNWKFNSGDAKERAHWDEYMQSYAEAISATSTDSSPWYIIPADKKWFTRLAVSEAIVQKLVSMNLHYPEVTDADRADLQEAKRLLERE